MLVVTGGSLLLPSQVLPSSLGCLNKHKSSFIYKQLFIKNFFSQTFSHKSYIFQLSITFANFHNIQLYALVLAREELMGWKKKSKYSLVLIYSHLFGWGWAHHFFFEKLQVNAILNLENTCRSDILEKKVWEKSINKVETTNIDSLLKNKSILVIIYFFLTNFKQVKINYLPRIQQVVGQMIIIRQFRCGHTLQRLSSDY